MHYLFAQSSSSIYFLNIIGNNSHVFLHARFLGEPSGSHDDGPPTGNPFFGSVHRQLAELAGGHRFPQGLSCPDRWSSERSADFPHGSGTPVSRTRPPTERGALPAFVGRRQEGPGPDCVGDHLQGKFLSHFLFFVEFYRKIKNQ